MDRRETYHFVVVCTHAAGVFLLGEFNGWSTTATPMRQTETDVWQIDIEMAAGQNDFTYFVIDDRYRTGRAPFGNTFMLPGSWATVMRTKVEAPQGSQESEQFPPSRFARSNTATLAASPVEPRSGAMN